MSGDQRRPDPEVWEQAQHRKGRRSDHQGGGNNKVISKFFVSNLPPKCSSQDLKEVLGGYGSFEGSYIARKVDKWGKRFSFVSFSGVKDIKRMEEELSDVWIGSYKLFITIARFVDGEKVSKSDSNPIRKTKVTYQKSHANHISGAAYEGGGSPLLNGSNNAAVGHGRSYVDSVMNRNRVDIIRVDDVVERFFEWNGYAFVGRVVDFSTLGSLKQLLRKNGCSLVDIKYLGGLTVVVVFHDSGEAERFIKDNSSWSVWFTSLAPWDGYASLEEERIAWIQVHGVPFQLTLDQVFDSIGSRYGKVVHSANMSGEDNNFSYALIGVLTKWMTKRTILRRRHRRRGSMTLCTRMRTCLSTVRRGRCEGMLGRGMLTMMGVGIVMVSTLGPVVFKVWMCLPEGKLFHPLVGRSSGVSRYSIIEVRVVVLLNVLRRGLGRIMTCSGWTN
ncbi:putative RNA recognition motif domain, nucleotide-binding alpha-beta plait domain superfamily [Helianthus annuus]|nr:putative RNA recognition motif domain, nucleotide-binding alpha-beta plait domain superfamily [Helianthus annuus]